jgi:PH (Pleckstrin Homology) domain-containing protein
MTSLDSDVFPMPLGPRQRVAAAVAIGLGFGGPFLLSVVLVATSGDPSLLMLPLPFLGGLWMAQGLSYTAVALEDRGVRLERRWLARAVPYASIADADRQRRAIGGFGAVLINAVFGSHGWRFHPRTGWHYLAITNTRDLVWLRTAAGLVVISPAEPDRFLDQLGARAHTAPVRPGGLTAPPAQP